MRLGQLASSASLVKVVESFLLFLVKRSRVVHPCPNLLLRRCFFGVGLEVMCSALAEELIAHPSQLAVGGYERSCHPLFLGLGVRSAVKMQFVVSGLFVCVLCGMQYDGLVSDWACENENVGGTEVCLP
jgi:hypothetical protein